MEMDIKTVYGKNYPASIVFDKAGNFFRAWLAKEGEGFFL
jgi:hypothetical protein